jgi:hypothetical protein
MDPGSKMEGEWAREAPDAARHAGRSFRVECDVIAFFLP